MTRFENKIIYQIELRTFTPEGTLKAAEKLLPHVKKTGFDIVYLMPVFAADDDMDENFWSKRQKASGSGNPKNSYRMKDYYNVDEEYGTNEDLKSFIDTAHSLGLLVLLDLVYFHCGPRAVFLEEHPDFVKRDENGDFLLGDWAFPQLNFDSPELCEYLWQNMEYYVRDFGADGYRCDVGERVPKDFWAEGTRRIKKINKNVLMLNEGYAPEWTEDVSEDGFFDANYNFDWYYTIRDAMEGAADAEAMRENWKKHYEQCHGVSGKIIRFIDNHDMASDCGVDRHEVNWGSTGVECALVISQTLDGTPFIFNGYEVASSCPTSMFVNRFSKGVNAIDWSNLLCPEGKKRLAFMKRLNAMYHKYKSLWKGSLEFLNSTDDRNIFAFVREYSGERVITVANVGRGYTEAVVDISPKGAKELLISGVEYEEKNKKLSVKLEPKGYLVFTY